jgi:ectoine hydroxylase-related dioxygenase (phytanoyl-CoA dioxygenase family)
MNAVEIESKVIDYQDNGCIITKMEDPSILLEVKKMIDSHFNASTSTYVEMTKEEFQDYAIKCQEKLQSLQVQNELIKSDRSLIASILGGRNIFHESVCFLRAVRPMSPNVGIEAPDFHRETFYSDHPETTKLVLNTWIPILNVSDNNTLRYVPKSHLIPDEDIDREYDESYPGKVDKFSSGHKMGFFWKPKKIISGIDLSNPAKMHFPSELGYYAAFSSMTIHGGAYNYSDKIRFVIGFGLINGDKIPENKNFFAAGGLDHFIPPTSS